MHSTISAMNSPFLKHRLGASALMLVSACAPVMLASAGEVSFNFDVRPLLSTKCFSCHGADAAKRKAKLRLDDRAVALEKKAIVPGDPEHSSLIEHINSTDPKKVMPPPSRHMALTDAEKKILHSWIKEGAMYEPHWAFTTPLRPDVNDAHPIDALVREEVTKKGW